MRVVPLGCSNINWVEFISMTTEVVGRSPMRSLDAAKIKPGDPFSFIAALAELDQAGTGPNFALQICYPFLEHVYVSFLVHAEPMEVRPLANMPLLKISSFEGKDIPRRDPDMLYVMSGTLYDWRAVTVSSLTTEQHESRQQFFNHVYNWFKMMNLRGLFQEYTEVQRPSYFSLERRR